MDKPHMTPDQIKDAAIEAAIDAAYLHMEHANVSDAVRAAIDAYEAAMWIEGEPPKDGRAYLCAANGAVIDLQWFERVGAWAHGADYDHGWKPTRFSPLPQPPTAKGETMTTIDQIKKAAIEAAHKEFCTLLKKGPPGGAAMKCAIDAYEAAMNQQPENAPMDELVLAKRRDYLISPNLWIVARRISAIGEWQCVYGTRYQDREILYFRPLPLPQPPEVKHEPA